MPKIIHGCILFFYLGTPKLKLWTPVFITFIQDNHLNIKQFSQQAGIPYRTVQNYLLGKTAMGSDAIVKIYANFGINIAWLLTGKGSMFLNEKPEINEPPKWLSNWWQQSDEAHKTWLKIQLNQILPVTKNTK